jgi:hypothetical protein
MNPTYPCTVCGASYLREDLAQACSTLIVEEKVNMPFGTVFRCEDGLIGILYDVTPLGKQTHFYKYVLARADLDENVAAPGVEVSGDYLRKAKPITERDFIRVRELLTSRIASCRLPAPPHVEKIIKLELSPLL